MCHDNNCFFDLSATLCPPFRFSHNAAALLFGRCCIMLCSGRQAYGEHEHSVLIGRQYLAFLQNSNLAV